VLNDNQLTSDCVPTLSRLVRRANIQLLNLTDNHLDTLDLGTVDEEEGDGTDEAPTSALRMLMVSFNQLTSVSFGRLRLPQLNECDFSFNRLEAVPNGLLSLAPSLSRLGVAHNAGLLSQDEDKRLLALFADGSSGPSRLEHLHLDGTGLTRVPLAALARMPATTTLTMSDNAIADITGLAPLVRDLQVLDVSVNRLAFLPVDLASHCASLQDLNVCSNFVTEVPPSFEAMHAFTDVDLSNNRLIGVPRAALVPKSAFCPSTVRLAMNMFNDPGRVDAEVGRFGFEDAAALAVARAATARALAADPASAGEAANLLAPSLCETRIPVSAGNVNVGWAEMRGRRPDQQDAAVCERVRAPPVLVDAAHAAYQRRTGASQVPFTSPRVRPEDQGHMWLLTGVFDGHAGTAAAEIAASHVAPFIRSFLREEMDAAPVGPLDEEQLHAVVTRALHRSCREIHQETVRAGVPDGTTGIFVLVSECFAWTATVGDSRALMGHVTSDKVSSRRASQPRDKRAERRASMVAESKASALARSNRLSPDGSSRGATAAADAAAAGTDVASPASADARAGASDAPSLKGPIRLTVGVSDKAQAHLDFSTIDHSPHSEEERDRIRRDGGFVSDAGRVQGVLALSRAFGDIAQQPAVTWEPDVAFHFFDSAAAAQVLVLACDGVFDVMSSSAVLELAVRPDASVFASAARVRDAAFFGGSSDNITAMIVRIPRA
jgi:serine/threonine protein phosphatase PrpC